MLSAILKYTGLGLGVEGIEPRILEFRHDWGQVAFNYKVQWHTALLADVIIFCEGVLWERYSFPFIYCFAVGRRRDDLIFLKGHEAKFIWRGREVWCWRGDSFVRLDEVR